VRVGRGRGDARAADDDLSSGAVDGDERALADRAPTDPHGGVDDGEVRESHDGRRAHRSCDDRGNDQNAVSRASVSSAPPRVRS